MKISLFFVILIYLPVVLYVSVKWIRWISENGRDNGMQIHDFSFEATLNWFSLHDYSYAQQVFVFFRKNTQAILHWSKIKLFHKLSIKVFISIFIGMEMLFMLANPG